MFRGLLMEPQGHVQGLGVTKCYFIMGPRDIIVSNTKV